MAAFISPVYWEYGIRRYGLRVFAEEGLFPGVLLGVGVAALVGSGGFQYMGASDQVIDALYRLAATTGTFVTMIATVLYFDTWCRTGKSNPLTEAVFGANW